MYETMDEAREVLDRENWRSIQGTDGQKVFSFFGLTNNIQQRIINMKIVKKNSVYF